MLDKNPRGMNLKLGSNSPGSTNSSTSAMVILPAIAIAGLKFRAVPLKIRFPVPVTFPRFNNGDNQRSKHSSNICGITIKNFCRASLLDQLLFQNPQAYRMQEYQHHAARHLSAKELPWGIKSTSNSHASSISLSKTSFSPT